MLSKTTMVSAFLICLMHSYNLPGQAILDSSYHFAHYDGCNSILETAEGDILMWGNNSSSRDLADESFLLIKTDAGGKQLWAKSFGGDGRDRGRDMLPTRDGGYLLLGYTQGYGASEEDIYLAKIDKKGNLLWEKTYGGSGRDRGLAIVKNRHGGYVFTGTMETVFGKEDIFITAIDEQGEVIWQQTHGGNDHDFAFDIIQTYDGNFLIAGSTWSFSEGESDVYLLKVDGNGKRIWSRTYGGAEVDGAWALQQTYEGSIVMSGYTNSFRVNGSAGWLLKLKANGDTLWTRLSHGRFNDLLIHDDGAYLTVGNNQLYEPSIGSVYEVFLQKTSPEGDSLWSANIGGEVNKVAYSFCKAEDGRYLITGSSYNKRHDPSGIDDDVLLIKAAVPTSARLKERISAGIFPNPNRGEFQLNATSPLKRIEVYDTRGRKVFIQEQAASNLQPSAQINLPALEAGTYYARVTTTSGIRTEPFVLY